MVQAPRHATLERSGLSEEESGVGRQSRWRLVWAGLMSTLLLMVAVPAAHASGTLTVSIVGKGNVTGTGINCSTGNTGDCSQSFTDTQVCDYDIKPPCHNETADAALTANDVAGTGYTYDHSDACGTARSCYVTMDGSYAVTVVFRDNQAPSVSLSAPSGYVRGTISMSATASDNTAVTGVSFSVRGAVQRSFTSGPFTASIDTTKFTDGAAALDAAASDAAGNVTHSAGSVTIDNTPPSLQVSGPNNQTFGPAKTQTWTFQAADATSGTPSVSCSVVPTGQAPSFGACANGLGGHSVTNKPQGAYTFTAHLVDGAGNATDVTRSFAIDTTAPDTTISAGLEDGGSSSAATQTWALASSEAGSTFECRVYPAALTPGAWGPCSDASSHTAAGFAPGTYTFEARATDAVGNVDASSAKRTFSITEAAAGTPVVVTPVVAATAAPVAPVVVPPVVVTPAAKMLVPFSYGYDVHGTRTKLLTATLKGVPAGSTVTVSCRKGCPAKTSFKKAGARGNLGLKSLVHKSFKAGAVITVVIAKPGFVTVTKTLKILAGKRPVLTST
jgi:hypothetical protein